MHAKLLKACEENINKEVPYFENKEMAVNLVCEVAAKTMGKKWTKRKAENFRKRALFG